MLGVALAFFCKHPCACCKSAATQSCLLVSRLLIMLQFIAHRVHLCGGSLGIPDCLYVTFSCYCYTTK